MRTRVRNRPGLAGSLAVEDELDLLGATEVEIFADHLFEEQAAMDRTIEHPGERELGLQDRDLITVAGLVVGGGERVRQAVNLLRSSPSILSADNPSQICCRRWGSAQFWTPLSA